MNAKEMDRPPMSRQLHSAKDLPLPKQWAHPIETEFSDILANEILKLRPVH